MPMGPMAESRKYYLSKAEKGSLVAEKEEGSTIWTAQ